MTEVIPSRSGKRAIFGLVVLALPTLMMAMDLSMLYVAVPPMSADLGASSTEQLWAVDTYGFVLAALLITMGNLGDRIGRRRLLLIGASAFAVVSAVAAYSPNIEVLIAARALLGVAGATLMPSTLALINSLFSDRRQHAMAIAAYMTCFMGGIALGPVVGGALLEHFWWGSTLLLPIPVMVLLVVAAPFLLPEARGGAAHLGLGNYEQALFHAERGLTLRRQAGDRQGEIYSMVEVARAWQGMGMHPEVIALCEHALSIEPNHAYPPSTAGILDTLGLSLRHTGDVTRAMACWCEALEIFDRFGDPRADELRARLDALGE